MQEEIWKDIENYEGMYQVSTLGRVKSLDRIITRKNGIKIKRKGVVLSQTKNREGYYTLSLSKEGNQITKTSHRLIAISLIPNIKNKPQINHINGIKTDNRVENLEWCTNSENQIHSVKFLNKKGGSPWLGKKGKSHISSKTIYQYNLDGSFVAEYGSVCECAEKLGISRSPISGCARGVHKQSYGFKWSYIKLH